MCSEPDNSPETVGNIEYEYLVHHSISLDYKKWRSPMESFEEIIPRNQNVQIG